MSSSGLTGSQLIAESLASLGITHIFGIVGIPVIDVAEACIARGIQFISFRNEQAASYAASIYGYLTGLPGVCLVVGGPGVVHALAGVENAKANAFPLLLIAGSSESHQIERGAFQELNQVSAVQGYTKFAAKPASPDALPFLLEKAYRTAYFGRPGATYVDLPADIIQSTGLSVKVPTSMFPGAAPRSQADPVRVSRAASLLINAKSPLLIVGKGAASGFEALRSFHEKFQIPFLPTPMGKGILPDSDPLNVSAARSAALKSADVILLAGARLNWILHYGQAPKFSPDVKIIQIDIAAEEIGNNAGSAEFGMVGDVGLVIEQLQQALPKNWKSPPLLSLVENSIKKNVAKAATSEDITDLPLKYQPVYKSVRNTLDKLVADKSRLIYVSEGANTMDISRSSFPLDYPKRRLDAGTNATMGVGLGYAIAAKAAEPDAVVVAIEGDSAFGFSAIEIETAVRSKLPIIIIVMNNSGVYHGVDPRAYTSGKPLPSTALQLDTKYHELALSLGGDGYLVRTPSEIEDAVSKSIRSGRTSLINVIIDSGKDKKLEFAWMQSAKAKI